MRKTSFLVFTWIFLSFVLPSPVKSNWIRTLIKGGANGTKEMLREDSDNQPPDSDKPSDNRLFPWGKYPSEAQASAACKAWASKGGTYSLKVQRVTEIPPPKSKFPSFRQWVKSNKELAREADSRPEFINGRRSLDAYDEYLARRKAWEMDHPSTSQPIQKNEWITSLRPRRKCEKESSTSQYLGYEEDIQRDNEAKSTTSKVLKHFRY